MQSNVVIAVWRFYKYNLRHKFCLQWSLWLVCTRVILIIFEMWLRCFSALSPYSERVTGLNLVAVEFTFSPCVCLFFLLVLEKKFTLGIYRVQNTQHNEKKKKKLNADSFHWCQWKWMLDKKTTKTQGWFDEIGTGWNAVISDNTVHWPIKCV